MYLNHNIIVLHKLEKNFKFNLGHGLKYYTLLKFYFN